MSCFWTAIFRRDASLARSSRPASRHDDSTWLSSSSNRLEPHAGGTRFTYDHTGFTGVGGVFLAKLLGHVRRKMLRVSLPPLLDDLDQDGTLRPGSTLGPKSLG